jgi:hypothetical protein
MICGGSVGAVVARQRMNQFVQAESLMRSWCSAFPGPHLHEESFCDASMLCLTGHSLCDLGPKVQFFIFCSNH